MDLPTPPLFLPVLLLTTTFGLASAAAPLQRVTDPLPTAPGLSADYLDGRDSATFANKVHDHDDRYYTEAESDARFQRHLGAWDVRVVGVVYQAPTDGFVVAYYQAQSNSGGGQIAGLTDPTDPPTTGRAFASGADPGGPMVAPTGSFTMPVRAGDFWMVTQVDFAGTGSTRVQWLPFG